MKIQILCASIVVTIIYSAYAPLLANQTSDQTVSPTADQTIVHTSDQTVTETANKVPAQVHAQAPAAQPTVFKLSAQKVELSLDQLNDVGLDLKNILTVSKHLYDEVMVQPVTVITEPEIIAGTVISIPVGTQPTGPPRPARKERVDSLMSQLKPVIDLLKKNADDFMHESQVTEYSDEMKTKVDPLFKKWLAYMDDLYARLLDLEKMTVGPTYDNYAIATTCELIERDIKQIDEVRRPIYKLVQEEGKKLAKSN